MKKIFVLLLSVVLGINIAPCFAEEDEQAIILYADDFESGSYHVVTNDADTVKELYKDGQLQWTFVKKDGKTFGNTFPDASLIKLSTDTNPPVNNSMVMDTGSYLFKNETEAYLNLPQKYIDGKLTVEFRVKRYGQSTTNFLYTYSEPKTGYGTTSDIVNIFQYFVNSAWRTNIRTGNSYIDKFTFNKMDGYKEVTSAKGYPWIKVAYDLDNQTVTTSYRTGSADNYTVLGTEDRKWYPNGTEGEYYMADGIASLCFTGESYLAIDDMTVSYISGAKRPVVSDGQITGDPVVGQTLNLHYTYRHDENIPEKGSVIRWYRSSDAEYKKDVEFLAETTSVKPTYQIKEDDAGHYIFCTIEPRCEGEENNIGRQITTYYPDKIRTTYTEPAGEILSPKEGDEFVEGQAIPITIKANCISGSVAKVEYYVDGNKIGESATEPFQGVYTDAQAGDHSLYAILYGAAGEKVSTGQVNFTCRATSIQYEYLGELKKKPSSEVDCKYWSIGCECLDRDMAIYNDYKEYVGQTGANRMRIQGGWAKCEKLKGVYDWAWLDEVVDDALSRNVHPWICLCYGNSIYPGGGGTTLSGGIPTSEEALEAWDNWVRALVTHFKDKVFEWEIWNEADHGSCTIGEYAEFFIRTSDIVKEVQPQARTIGMAAAKSDSSNLKTFLSKLKTEGKLDNLDVVTVHGYPTNPDSNTLTTWKNVCASYADHIEVWVGETGAPHRKGGSGALSSWSSTELKQAKWVARRMLSARAKEVPISIFTLVDLKYDDGGTNWKGLIHVDTKTMTMGKPKQAFYAFQNITSVFDGNVEIISGYKYKTNYTKSLHFTAYENKNTKKQILAFWDSSGAPTDEISTSPVEIRVENGNFDEPVYIDVRTGIVYAMTNWEKEGAAYTFYDVPVYDAPVVIADRSAVVFDSAGTTISEIKIYNGEEALAETLAGVEAVTAKVTVSTGTGQSLPAMIIIAVYDENDCLLAAKSEVQDINGGQKGIPVQVTMELNDAIRENACRVKAFLWDKSDLYPIAKATAVDVK